MTRSRSWMLRSLALMTLVGALAIPNSAQAWWRGGWGGVGIGFVVPPVYVAPPVYYPPPPVYLRTAPGGLRAATRRLRPGAGALGHVMRRRRLSLPACRRHPCGDSLLLPRQPGPGLGPLPLSSEAAAPPQEVFAGPIEDYAIIGDCTTGALVGRDGSIDWLCWPRFDSDSCFAALLGTRHDGHWRIGPAALQREPQAGSDGNGVRSSRFYRDDTLVLETRFATADGEVAVIDFMPIVDMQAAEERVVAHSSVVRLVRGLRGRVDMAMQLRLRFDYGNTVPWVTRLPDVSGIRAIAGPDMVVLRSAVETQGSDFTTRADFAVGAGETVAFVLTHAPSHMPVPPEVDPEAALAETEAFWRKWSGRCTYDGVYAASVRRSLLTLKALTFAETGGMVAALTTSLPEQPGGVRNWDYRYCWLRDATLTLQAFMHAGYFEEAQAWSDWLHRSVAGRASQVQIMYGLAGERRLDEWEVGWLAGYQGARPVRIGNAAAGQLQLDVYGEVMDALHEAFHGGLELAEDSWDLQREFVTHLESVWELPDEGIWEVRGGRRHFTFSKIMAWVAFDRGIRVAERLSLEAPLDRWREIRDRIHALVCDRGFNAERNSFVQSFDNPALDASLLLISTLNFLPPEDPRVIGTIAAIESDLLVDGCVRRYHTQEGDDGLPPGEGAFLACSFWLADAYAQQGRFADAKALFERLLGFSNDLGLLAEEYDPRSGRQLGNFPQAFTHTALIRTALVLEHVAAGEAAPVRGESMAMAAGSS